MVNLTALGFCNTTSEDAAVNETPIWHNFTFHHFGLILSAAFGLFAVVMSCYLMFMHATHYLKPHEQKHIIRILFMVPIYSIVSFLSYLFYQHTVYYEVLRDCYEAFAIASFFSLMCSYIAPDLHDQKEYFRSITPRKWWNILLPWRPLQRPKPPRSGLTWFNIVWFCVFQYCFIRVFMTIVAVVTQATGRYCIDSLSPEFAHVWVTVIEGVAVTVAMYTIIQFYLQLRDDTADHHPKIKVLSIKGVIFFSFWQTLVIDFLVSSGTLKPSDRISLPDIRVGLPSLLLCIEMALFSILHLFAYPWKVYDAKRSAMVASETVGGFDGSQPIVYHGGWLGYKAFLDAYNPWDIIKAVGRGFRWMAVGRRYREQDISYKHTRNDTVLQEGLKQNGAYQKLNEPSGSREHSPERPAYAPSNTYGDYPPPTAYGVTPVADTSYHGASKPTAPGAAAPERTGLNYLSNTGGPFM